MPLPVSIPINSPVVGRSRIPEKNVSFYTNTLRYAKSKVQVYSRMQRRKKTKGIPCRLHQYQIMEAKHQNHMTPILTDIRTSARPKVNLNANLQRSDGQGPVQHQDKDSIAMDQRKTPSSFSGLKSSRSLTPNPQRHSK